jgi:hypothetical protein
MVNLDLSKVLPALSKVLPTRPYALLAAFLPGLFFETSILLANPDLVSRLIANLQKSFPAGLYTLLDTRLFLALVIGISLFLAFVIGDGFMLLVTFIQYIFARVYRLLSFTWRHICGWPLLPLAHWAMNHPTWRRPWLAPLSKYLSETSQDFTAHQAAVQGCWGKIASQLLKSRYGIDPNQFEQDEWPVLFWTLPTPRRWEVRGDLSMIAAHATGWSGLAAILLAPALRSRYYLTFSLFLILSGLIHDFYLIQRNLDPTSAGYVNIRATLRAFPRAPAQKPHDDTETEESTDEE